MTRWVKPKPYVPPELRVTVVHVTLWPLTRGVCSYGAFTRWEGEAPKDGRIVVLQSHAGAGPMARLLNLSWSSKRTRGDLVSGPVPLLQLTPTFFRYQTLRVRSGYRLTADLLGACDALGLVLQVQ